MRLELRTVLYAALSGAVLTTALAPALVTRGGADRSSVTPLVTAASKNQVDTRSAAAVRAAYRQRWAPAVSTELTSGGTAKGCTAGTTKSAQQDATRTALDFARGLVGENAVSFTKAYDAAAARSALISSANGALSHDPPKSWKCWTKAGHDASASSNILLTGASPDIATLVNLYLADPGSSNTAAGHRRWLLRPEATTMGSGNAQGSWFGNAIYVFTFRDDNKKAAAQKYYGWPSAGYFPSQLEPGGRWSLSSSTGAGFAKAKVAVTGPDGKAVALKQRATQKGYGDNTLVWDLTKVPADVTSGSPQTYTVRVTGITGGPTSSYTYYVRLFDPTAPAPAGEPGSLPVSK